METVNFMLAIAFFTILQIALPFLMKRTVVFGVTVPIDETKNTALIRYKKIYALLTFLLSCIALISYYLWNENTSPTEDSTIFVGMFLPFVIILGSLALYFFFHAKVTQLKKDQQWFKDRKQVKISELDIRSKDEMVSSLFFAMPMLITLGLIVFSLLQYDQFPNKIPTHWGPNGQPDAFTTKSVPSVISLPLILLTMQAMFLGINEMTKRSGIKLSARNTTASRLRQLTLRKYTSWFMLIMAILITILFTFLQFTTLYESMVSDLTMVLMPLIFLFTTIGGAITLAVKVGKIDSDLDVVIIDEESPANITDADEDQYWKGGIIYFNKNDPSIFVEKRFGIGWTLNFARPLGYFIIFGPIIVIVLLSFI